MKKFLFALLAVSMILPASAMAGTTVYGQFRYSVASVEDGSIDGLVAADNVSLLGVKGSYGDEVKAYFHLQMGARADGDGAHNHDIGLGVDLVNNVTGVGPPDGIEDIGPPTQGAGGGNALAQRFFFGGLKGSFGNLKYGRLSDAYKMVGFKMDPLYNTSHIGAKGATYSTALATYGLSKNNNGFVDNSIEYTSPKIAGGLTVNVGLYLDDSNGDNHGKGAGIKYSANGITAGVQMLMNDAGYAPNGKGELAADQDAMRIHVAYKGEGFSVALSHETVETSATAEPTYIFAVAKFKLNDKTELAATIGVVDADKAVLGTTEGKGFTLTAFHDITTNTKVFASYASVDLDDSALVEDNPTALSFGIQHKFSVSGN